jgi:uncharacterized membrane protein (DUF373 family)
MNDEIFLIHSSTLFIAFTPSFNNLVNLTLNIIIFHELFKNVTLLFNLCESHMK